MAKIKKFLTDNFEALSQRASYSVEAHRLEEYHEFLRGYTDIFTKNVFQKNDYTTSVERCSCYEKW